MKKFGTALVVDVNKQIYVPCDLPPNFHEVFPNSALECPQPVFGVRGH